MVSRRRFAWNGNMDGCRLGFGKITQKSKGFIFLGSPLHIAETAHVVIVVKYKMECPPNCTGQNAVIRVS